MVKELTGLEINHVVNVDFLGFVRAVDAIDCVYVDVDRRYYHNNAESTPKNMPKSTSSPATSCSAGKKALQYVRYRHTDTDLVRSARQQDFISEARERVPIDDLLLGRNELIDIFTEYTTSDISDTADDDPDAQPLRRIAQRGDQGGPLPRRTRPELRLRLPGSDPRRGRKVPRQRSERRAARLAGRVGTKQRSTPRARRKKKHPVAKPKPPGSDGLVPAVEAGALEGKSVARKVSHELPGLLPDQAALGRLLRRNATPMNTSSTLASTTSKTPTANGTPPTGWSPSWNSPTGPTTSASRASRAGPTRRSSRTRAKRRRSTGASTTIYIDGDRVKLIAWHRGNNTYWVSNDLLNTLTNDQMVGIARSTKALIPNPKPKPKRGKAGNEPRESRSA